MAVSASTGGMLWKEALTPLSEIHWLLDLIFLIYIFCTAPWQLGQMPVTFSVATMRVP